MSRELFESDHYAWLQVGIEQAKACNLTEVAEYLEEMSRSEKRSLASHSIVLVHHLLKWKYQPDHQSSSWRGSIDNARGEIKWLLKHCPSMKPIVYELAKDDYEYATKRAMKETGLERRDFPQELEFTLEQLLDDDFYPN
jgi:hypothetical protein